MAHIHLKAYFELALHNKDDHDEAHRTDHDPQEQLGCGQTTHSVTAIISIREQRETSHHFINKYKSP